MFREILTAIGLVELISPGSLVGAAERIALENPDDCDLRSWVGPAARIEGLAILILLWRSDASYAVFKRFLGVIGLLALVSPRAYVDRSAGIAYTDATKCEWRPWVYPGTRIVGLFYVIIALADVWNSRPSDGSPTQR